MTDELNSFLDEFQYIDTKSFNSFIATLEGNKNKEKYPGRLTQFIADKIEEIIREKEDHLLGKFNDIILDVEPDQSSEKSTSERITDLVAKAACKYLSKNRKFQELFNQNLYKDSDDNSELNKDSDDNSEPSDNYIDEISKYLTEFTNKLIDHLRKFDKKKLTIKVIDGSCTINNYNLDNFKRIQDISEKLDKIFKKKTDTRKDIYE